MNNDYTHISLVIDRSGSMGRIRDDAEGGVRHFIADQQALPGKATLTLVDFDDTYSVAFQGDLADAPVYTLIPRGSTALNDAIGKTIVTTGEFLALIPETDRPGKVVFVIVTDGGENASQEFSGYEGRDRVKALVERQERDYAWEFVFLAADMDAFATGSGYGIANSANFAATAASVGQTYSVATAAVATYRGAGGQSMPRLPDVDADGKAKANA